MPIREGLPRTCWHFGHLRPGHGTVKLAIAMASSTENMPAVDKVQALVQLLRTRSSEEIRQRMYDNPPGSPWWTACKTELDVRNGERAATALVDTSRVLEKMRQSTEHLDKLTENLLQATIDLTDLFKGARESGRRLELAVYVILGVTLMQLFYVEELHEGHTQNHVHRKFEPS